jgi:glycosyltransferase involved in cell wall biosynthesis
MSGSVTGRDVFIVCNDVEGLGGVQRFARILADMLTGLGHHVRLVGVTRPETVHRYGDDVYETYVLHERQPPSPVYGRWWRRYRPGAVLRNTRRRWWIRRGARTLSSLFATARPGGVVVCPQVWAMEWVAAADRHGMPVVGMSHESYTASKATTRYVRVKKFFAGADRLLLLTQADADAWANDGMSNAGAMPNPLTLVPTRTSSLDAKVVIGLGRLSHEKGFDLLVEAWALVAPEHPDWTLRLYGGGPEEAELRRQVAAAGLEGSVAFMGHTDDAAGALADSSVLALPSRAEGWPLVLAEAMSVGVPCVAFDCAPSIREIVTDGDDGFVVTAGNVASFAEALRHLIADDELRRAMGKRALASVRRFTAEVVAQRWQRELDNLFR